jgi:uncharacterized membrane protein YdjX (TVP38/TMEM64 family)
MSIRPKSHLNKLLGALLLVVLLGGAWLTLAHFGISAQDIYSGISTLAPVPLILLMVILPIFGFSIALVYVIAGARFGIGPALLLVTLATAVHISASYWIARSFLRSRIERMLAKHHHHLPHAPEGEHASVALLLSLVPGLPYAARNYMLGLAELPFRTCMAICLPVYVVRSSVAIAFGEFSGNLTVTKGVVLGSIFVIKICICAYVIKRLRAKRSTQSTVAASNA